jgi:Flp pilus assembly protein TadG
MFNLSPLPAALRNFARDSRGNVMIMFAGMAVGLVLMVGAGVDYGRAVEFKTALQGLADASALAGASAYVSPATAANAVTVATNYWNNGVSRLPSNGGVGTPTVTTSSDASGYYVQVSVSGSTIKTTFLSIITNSIGAVVSAKAKDPIVSATVDLNGWTSDAGDGNSVYWYKVPADRSIPAFTQANIDNQTYNLVYSNVVTTAPTLSFSVAAAQQMAFAFVNLTAGHSPGWNYCNQYGGCTGTTHIFYSQLNNPNGASSTDAPNGYGYSNGANYTGDYQGEQNNGGGVKNCSLQVTAYTGTAPTESPSFGAPRGKTCFTPPETINPYFAPSCASMDGKSIHYAWNDMGGGTDDTDYNDGQYNFSCSTAGIPNTGVILTD